MGTGVVAGFPVIGLKATLLDGAYHDVRAASLSPPAPCALCPARPPSVRAQLARCRSQARPRGRR